MVDRPFALHHHFYSSVVAGLQGQPYPIATRSFSQLSLIGARDQQRRRRRRRSVPESCSRGLVVCPSPAAPGGPSPAEEGGKPESSAFTGLCAMFYNLKKSMILTYLRSMIKGIVY
jgi:hypothetical protein